MKTKLILFLLCFASLSVMGQIDKTQGTIRREKCSICGKVVSQCQYKGKHPKPQPEKVCTTCGKVLSRCKYKGKHPKPEERCDECNKPIRLCSYNGKHPKPQPEKTCSTCGYIISQCQYNGNHPQSVEENCSTCSKPLSQCSYNGKHPEPEAAGYDVTLSCNVSSASLYIDGYAYGSPSGTRFLKTGVHSVKITAKGYEDYSCNITVSSLSRSFSFSLTIISQTIKVNGVSIQMVAVPGGTFTMGGTSEQGSDVYEDEKPTHSITLSSYYIGKYEVTQELWQAVMGNNPSGFKGSQKPVEKVSWNDCKVFISKLNTLTNCQFRLPTEAEWEYAARGGSKSRRYKYSGGNKLNDVAWYTDNSGSTTSNVGKKSPNELDIYDMSGNVWEWCQDWYGGYSSDTQMNPTGASKGSCRVIRGGGWIDDAGNCRSSLRGGYEQNYSSNSLGLRLALSTLETSE